jgi:hypothetical protein
LWDAGKKVKWEQGTGGYKGSEEVSLDSRISSFTISRIQEERLDRDLKQPEKSGGLANFNDISVS